MRKVLIDGEEYTIYGDLLAVEGMLGWSWNVMVRPGGSISLYATRPCAGIHAVLFDTVDKPMGERARKVIDGIITSSVVVATVMGYAPVHVVNAVRILMTCCGDGVQGRCGHGTSER